MTTSTTTRTTTHNVTPTGNGSSAEAQRLADEPFAVSVVSSDVVYSGRVWDVRSDAFIYNDETTVRQYVDHTGAVAIVALDEDGRVLLIQQYRHPIREREWEIPAGLLDIAGEDPADTARRELAEETDLEAAQLEHLISIHTSPGGSDEIVHIYLARDLSAAPVAHEREAEEADIRIEWMPLAEAVAAVMAGRMRNGILVAGLLAAAERLRGPASATPIPTPSPQPAAG
mgnify:FL=1